MARNEDRDRGGRDREVSRRETSRDRDNRDRDERPSRDRGGRDHDDGGRDRDRGGRGGSRFEYQARNEDDVRKRAESGASDFDRVLKDGVKVWKPNDGDNCIRIVPPTWPGAKHFGYDVYVHYGVGPDRATYLDLRKMKDEADPISEEYEIVRRDDNDDDKDYLKQLAAKHRSLIYLIDRDNEKEGLQAWMMPSGLDRDIVKISIDKSNGEVLSIDHPEEGYDVTFEKKGKGIKTEYLAPAIARRSSPLGKAAWLEEAMQNPLPEILQYYDYDHIKKAFGGGGAHRGDGDRSDSRDRGSERDSGRDRGSDRGRDSQADDSRDGRDSGTRHSTRSREEADRDDSRSSTGRDREASRSSREETRGRSRPSEEPTWDSVHEMTGKELEDLVDQEKLKDVHPNEAKDDDDLADWICEELGLKKTEPRRNPKDEESTNDRLDRMRAARDRN